MYNRKVLLLGAGYMAKEYAKVLGALNVEYDVITRSRETADSFEKDIKKEVYACELVKFLNEHDGYTHAINAFKAEGLQDSNFELMNSGINDILSEKPGAWDSYGLRILSEKAKETGSRLLLAYNRRYYQPVMRAQELIAEDGGLKNIDFEFTEWPDRLGVSEWNRSIVDKVLIGNSAHVIDLAWYLAGRPREYAFYSDYNRNNY